MPQIERVEVMKKAPARCGICNLTPYEDGKPKPAVDTNVDVDWGNNFYICEDCVNVISDLFGRVDADTHSKLQSDYSDLERRHDRLRGKYKALENNALAASRGRDAEKRIRKSRRAA